jgi:aminomuconate-semialdehyde/2-hydroxymuconate-6-semialdehyde dehydrogenase
MDILNYINGQLQPAQVGAWLPNPSPRDGQVFSRIADSTAADVDFAVKAAQVAQPVWEALGRQGRHDALMRVAALVERDLEDFAQAESRDNGKPVALARKVDIPRAVANLRFFATAILHWGSEAHIMDGIAVNYTERSPVGVVGCISPWNLAALPLHLEDRARAWRPVARLWRSLRNLRRSRPSCWRSAAWRRACRRAC